MNTPAVLQKTSHQMQMGKAAIRTLILGQAGSREKAIIELIMNEIDAGATDVNIDIDDDLSAIHVYGNGRGFGSYENAVKRFGDLAFDHRDGDEVAMNRRYGTHGLGRAQILAFGRCIWASYTLKIECNLFSGKDLDVPFEITQYADSLFDGCRVDITFKDVLSFGEARHLRLEIERMSKYLPCRLHVNGATVNKSRGDVKWTAKTDKLGFILSNAQNGLSVFNDGVFIRDYPHSQFGISGDITSLDCTFAVNVARNDILLASCTLWPELKSLLKPFSDKLTKKTSSALTDSDRKQLFVQFLKGEFPPHNSKLPLQIRDTSGKYVSYKQLFSNATISVPDKTFSPVGEKINRTPNTLILSKSWLNEVGFHDVESFVHSVSEALSFYYSQFPRSEYEMHRVAIKKAKLVAFELLVAINSDVDYQTLDTKGLPPVLKAKHAAIDAMSSRISSCLRKGTRRVLIGQSHSALAWTDGVSTIHVERDVADRAFSGGHTSLFKVAMLLLHEYTHDVAIQESEVHSGQFYKNFHDALLNHDLNIVTIINETLLIYFKTRKKLGVGNVENEIRKSFNSFAEQLHNILNEPNSTEDDSEDDAA